jgi:tRNA(fMet)-specific endonuclease VapC
MGTFLLDTNIIIDVLKGNRDRLDLLIGLSEEQGHSLACCPINIAETFAGMRPNEEKQTKAFLQSLQLFPIAFPIAELAGRMKYDYARKGITLSLTDAIIAAVAIHNRLALITANVKDFPMPELALYPLPA